MLSPPRSSGQRCESSQDSKLTEELFDCFGAVGKMGVVFVDLVIAEMKVCELLMLERRTLVEQGKV